MKKKILAEGKHGTGGIPSNFLTRKFRKYAHPKTGAGEPFDWNKGYDVEQVIGKVTIKDQGTSFSCGGQAGAYFLEIQRRLQGFNEGSISAKSLYSPIAYAEGGGTTVSQLQTQIGAKGGNLELNVPSYYPDGQPMMEIDMESTAWMTDEMIKDAVIRAGFLPIQVYNNIESMAQAIRDYGAIIIEIDAKNNGTWRSQYPSPPTPKRTFMQTISPDPEVWTHFICSKAARLTSWKQIDFYNSWGADTGTQGVQSLRQDYIDSGYIVECFTFVSDRKVYPLSTNTDVWSGVVKWFRSQWGLPVPSIPLLT